MNLKPIERTPHYVTYVAMMLFSILVVSLTGCDRIRELIAPEFDQTETPPQLYESRSMPFQFRSENQGFARPDKSGLATCRNYKAPAG